MLRYFDIVISLIGLVLAFPLLLIIYVFCMFDTGSPIFCQKRV